MGLGSYWGEVIDVLREIIPVYDKVNSFISLGKDVEHRNRAIKGRVKKGDKILDAGSGFGNMSKTAAKIVDNDLKIILYDPLVPMLKNTDRLFDKKMDSACGVFEHVPFQDKEFDAVLSGYSLRDAISLKTAISEMHRVLKEDGKWVIVDLGKPDEPFLCSILAIIQQTNIKYDAFLSQMIATDVNKKTDVVYFDVWKHLTLNSEIARYPHDDDKNHQ